MPPAPQPLRHRRPNQAVAPQHQHPQWRDGILARACRSGSVASVLSTLLVSVISRRRTGSAAAGTNAASQWLWYPHARFVHGPSWRHTLTGYLIHHASSIFWASAYEASRPSATAPVSTRVAHAAAISSLAYGVDYHVVPRRLSPGFEHRLGAAGMCAVYAAFGLGLLLGTRQRPRPPRSHGLAQRGQYAQQQRRQQQRQP